MVTRRTQLARQLRAKPTDAELQMWRALRSEQLGVKFRRQFPLGPYVLDFVSLEARLVIEVDGSQHADNADDTERDRFVENQGFTVLRFWNNDVLLNTVGVMETIFRLIPQKIRSKGPTPP